MIAWLKELLSNHAADAAPAGVLAAAGPAGLAGAAVAPGVPGSTPARAGPRGGGATVVAHAQHAEPAGRASPRHPMSGTRARVSIGGEAETLAKQLVLVIDLNVCVGCHACVTSCKEWNTSGSAGPLADQNVASANPTGTFFNRVQTYEAGVFPATETIHFPKSCLHCEDPPCVPVCPTGASYKRKEDGIVLVDYDKCIGCKYCAWACPYGMRELDEERQVMTKCTLCVDRIYDEELEPEDRRPACVKACPTNARLFGDIKDPMSEVSIAVRERGGYSLMPEWDTKPANQYLPRRPTLAVGANRPMPSERDLTMGHHDPSDPIATDGSAS